MRIIRKRSTSTGSKAPRRATHSGRAAGITLVESMVVLAVFSLLVLTFFKSVILVRDGNAMMDHHNRVNTRCQHVLNRLGVEISSSVRLYGENDEGRALLGMLEGVSQEILADSKLPVLRPDGIVERDEEGVRSTGNCVLFLQAQRPFGYQAEGSTEDTCRIDLYRVVAFYLKRKEGVTGPLAEQTGGLDLVVYRSAPLIDAAQVQAVDEFERDRVLKMARKLRQVRQVFDTRKPVAQALTAFDDTGALDPNPPEPCVIPADPARGHQQWFAPTALAVATNGAPPQYGVARFARRVEEGEGFPHGFETRIIGGASARQILLHLTLVLEQRPSRNQSYADLHTMAVSRDF